jgi:hypothetical protein
VGFDSWYTHRSESIYSADTIAGIAARLGCNFSGIEYEGKLIKPDMERRREALIGKTDADDCNIYVKSKRAGARVLFKAEQAYQYKIDKAFQKQN